jgi:hypothetical protein
MLTDNDLSSSTSRYSGVYDPDCFRKVIRREQKLGKHAEHNMTQLFITPRRLRARKAFCLSHMLTKKHFFGVFVGFTPRFARKFNEPRGARSAFPLHSARTNLFCLNEKPRELIAK